MNVAILVPFRGGCPWRERSWAFVRERYEKASYEVVVGSSDADGFSRTQGLLDARAQTDADVLVLADADVFSDGWEEGIGHALRRGWSLPHGFLHRLSAQSTEALLADPSLDWRDLQLSRDNPQDSRPYRVHEAGTFLIVTAEAFDTAPPDPRFTRWGQEDDAFAAALHTLVGKPWRGEADLVHLWHPPEPRRSRVVGNEANKQLLRRYNNARRAPELMRPLIEEGKSWLVTASDSTAVGSPSS